MDKSNPTREEMAAGIKALEDRLWEAEQTLNAIRCGEVDALVVSEETGERLYTLKGADRGYRVLVESINEGALILSEDDSIYYCNRCFSDMLSLPIQKIVGTTLDRYVPENTRPKITGLIRESRGGSRAEAEVWILRNGGTLLPVKMSMNSVVLEDFHGVCAIVTDLSVPKRAELELRSTAEKLRRMNDDLQDFAFIASHDLQEPLRKIQAFGSRIARSASSKLDEIEKDSLARMQNAANRMSQFINDLLKYSRLATQTEPLVAFNLREAVEEALADLELAIERSRAVVEVSGLPTIEGKKYQVRQLFLNLVANALKFHGEQPPKIRIYSRASENGCQVCVEDNGIGFDEAYLDRIFMPFQRLHARGLYEGTGMGLAICRKIVERHGWTITAESTPGKGATFIIGLTPKPDSSAFEGMGHA